MSERGQTSDCDFCMHCAVGWGGYLVFLLPLPLPLLIFLLPLPLPLPLLLAILLRSHMSGDLLEEEGHVTITPPTQ